MECRVTAHGQLIPDKKVSIIVPVYNVSAYLEECIRSLMEQDYKNLEIIPVDDGSPDDCGAILDRLAAEDPRIKPIHKANGGAASARNAGLDAATGEYISFVDGDDMAERSYISHLVEIAETADADIAVCGFYYWSQHKLIPFNGVTLSGIYDGRSYLSRFLFDWSCSLMWNKIFRKSIIGNLRMAERHRIDDEFFTYRTVMNANRIVVSSDCLYRYRQRVSSVMNTSAENIEQILLDRVEYTSLRLIHVTMAVPELENAFFLDALDSMTRYWRHSKDMPRVQNAIRSWVNAHRHNIFGSSLSAKQKAAYLISLYIKKPQICGETDSFELEQVDYFS
jgi:glycosyltransferase involved in cell wall biosynthesis